MGPTILQCLCCCCCQLQKKPWQTKSFCCMPTNLSKLIIDSWNYFASWKMCRFFWYILMFHLKEIKILNMANKFFFLFFLWIESTSALNCFVLFSFLQSLEEAHDLIKYWNKSKDVYHITIKKKGYEVRSNNGDLICHAPDFYQPNKKTKQLS